MYEGHSMTDIESLQSSAPADPNFMDGQEGVIAVDKIANKILFLAPLTYDTVLTLGGFASRVHEIAISPDRKTALVPIYGDGKHGDNPNPGHLVAVFDLQARRHLGDISTAPYLAPHGLRWGPEGQLYCVCENSGVVLELDVDSWDIRNIIEVGSNKAHRMEVLPDGSKLYTENEEDACASVIDLKSRKRISKIVTPGAVAGIGLSPDGKTVILVDATKPQIFVVDTVTDTITRTIELTGHAKPAQIARYSPDGKHLVVTSFEEPLATILDPALDEQRLVCLGQGPMNMAFHADGRTALIANQGDGTICVVDLVSAEVLRSLPVGQGVETLSFF
jgi:DNA-binding beta-propeller fold protein YncE